MSYTTQQAPSGNGQIPQISQATVEDSAQILSGAIAPQLWANSGRPALPNLWLPLDPGQRQIQGVSLHSATTELLPFNPTVTRMVTEEVYIQEEPQFSLGEAWYPDQSFAFSTFAVPGVGGSDVISRGQLLAIPFQYQGDQDAGTLRAFTQMVFEVTYLDPAQAPDLADDQQNPEFISILRRPASAGSTTIEVKAVDNDEVENVAALIEDNGQWTRVLLTAQGDDTWTGEWSGAPNSFAMIVTAQDRAGNLATDTQKGLLFAPRHIRLPLVLKQPADGGK